MVPNMVQMVFYMFVHCTVSDVDDNIELRISSERNNDSYERFSTNISLIALTSRTATNKTLSTEPTDQPNYIYSLSQVINGSQFHCFIRISCNIYLVLMRFIIIYKIRCYERGLGI